MTHTILNTLITGLMLVMMVTRAQTRMMTVAAIFDEGGESQHEIAFKHAVEAVNRNRCEARVRTLYNYIQSPNAKLVAQKLNFDWL